MKVIFFANTDWYLYNFRLGLAKFLRDRNFEVVMFSPDGPYGPLLQAEGFRWITLDMDRLSINPRREMSVLRQIAAVYASEKPDIVHHFTIKCVVYGSLIAWLRRIPSCVNAVEGMGYVFASDQFRARTLRPIVRGLMKCVVSGKRSRLILHNSDDLEIFGRERRAPRDNVRMILGAGVDTSLFTPRQPQNNDAPRATTKVLYAGRLLWDKGVAEYVEAAQRLRSTGAPVEFLMAGTPDPGNPASVPEQQVARWQTDGWVNYLGHVTDMAALLRSVDIMVLPSYREGAPRSLIEAAASGLPIVATDVPGCRDVVDHGVNGVLVPVRQAVPLVEAIKTLHDQPETRARMGQAGRQKALNEFDERIVFEKTFAVYNELLAPVL